MAARSDEVTVHRAWPKYTVTWMVGPDRYVEDCRDLAEADALMTQINRTPDAVAVACTGLDRPICRGQFMRHQGRLIIPVGEKTLIVST